MTPAEFLSRLEGVRKCGAGYEARCPAHDDDRPSLTVSLTDDRILLNCHYGCEFDAICAAADVKPADLFFEPIRRNGDSVVATYDYVDEAGRLLFQVVRSTGKRFRQRHRGPDGEWVWNIKGVRRVLYRLPPLLAAAAVGRTVYVVEGEKDVHSIEAAGETATCNPMGAGKWEDDYSRFLIGADVIVVADRDDKGREHAALVAAAVRPVAKSLVVRQAKEGKDVTDHLSAGHRLDELADLADDEDAPSSSNGRAPRDGALARLHLVAASTVPMDRPRWVWDRRIPVGGTTLMPGREGLGKTAFVGHLAARLTRGDLPGEWGGSVGGAVVYIGYEDDRSTVLVPRLTAAGADLARFYFVDIPCGGTFVLDVDVDHLRDAIVRDGLDVALVIVDPLDSHLGSNVDSHRKAEVQSAIQKLAELAQELRCGAAGLAHLNKSDTRDLLSRVVGSVGFTTSVRAVLGIGEHPDDQNDRVCVLGKANMTDKTRVPAIRFRVEGTQVPHPDGGEPIDTARVVILGEEDGIDPDSIITGNTEERGALDEAVGWLRSMLSDGPLASAEIRRLATAEGVALATLKRAGRRLGIVVERDDGARGRPSTWSLDFGSRGSDPKPLDPKPKPFLTCTNDTAEGGFGSRCDVEPKPGSERPSDENRALFR